VEAEFLNKRPPPGDRLAEDRDQEQDEEGNRQLIIPQEVAHSFDLAFKVLPFENTE
jgi:hypothetical protein